MTDFPVCPECGCLSTPWQLAPNHRRGCQFRSVPPHLWSDVSAERGGAS